MADLYFKKFEKIYYLTRVGNKEELKVNAKNIFLNKVDIFTF